MQPLIHFKPDVDQAPELNHPQVGMFFDPDVELTQAHIECLYEAIKYAKRLMYGED